MSDLNTPRIRLTASEFKQLIDQYPGLERTALGRMFDEAKLSDALNNFYINYPDFALEPVLEWAALLASNNYSNAAKNFLDRFFNLNLTIALPPGKTPMDLEVEAYSALLAQGSISQGSALAQFLGIIYGPSDGEVDDTTQPLRLAGNVGVAVHETTAQTSERQAEKEEILIEILNSTEFEDLNRIFSQLVSHLMSLAVGNLKPSYQFASVVNRFLNDYSYEFNSYCTTKNQRQLQAINKGIGAIVKAFDEIPNKGVPVRLLAIQSRIGEMIEQKKRGVHHNNNVFDPNVPPIQAAEPSSTPPQSEPSPAPQPTPEPLALAPVEPQTMAGKLWGAAKKYLPPWLTKMFEKAPQTPAQRLFVAIKKASKGQEILSESEVEDLIDFYKAQGVEAPRASTIVYANNLMLALKELAPDRANQLFDPTDNGSQFSSQTEDSKMLLATLIFTNPRIFKTLAEQQETITISDVAGILNCPDELRDLNLQQILDNLLRKLDTEYEQLMPDLQASAYTRIAAWLALEATQSDFDGGGYMTEEFSLDKFRR